MAFRAYSASFDLNDDDDSDGVTDLGVPAWVSYQLNSGSPTGSADRPEDWIAISNLPNDVESPTDDSYRNSGFSRGHACMRSHAHRLGSDANYNTFCVVNAMPQKQGLNGGHWLSLERLCGIWANKYQRVWITCGPVFLEGESVSTIGDGSEVKVAIPHAFYKVVTKENPDDPSKPSVLAFVYEHNPSLSSSSVDTDHEPFLVSVDEIEQLTNLDFFSNLSEEIQSEIESEAATELWTWNLEDNVRRMMKRFAEGKQVDNELLQDLLLVQARRGEVAENDDLSDFEDLVPRAPRMRGLHEANERQPLDVLRKIRELEERIQALENRLRLIERGEKKRGGRSRDGEDSSLKNRIRRSLRWSTSGAANSGTSNESSSVEVDSVDSPPVTPSEIQIGTYNLELLGNSRRPFNGTDRPKRSEEDLQEIVDRIVVELDLEVVVFQEINTESDNWELLKSLLAVHGYKFEEGQSSGRNQFVVLAWDADEVEVDEDSLMELRVDTGFDLDGGCASQGLRKPIAGLFKAGQFDFRVVGVHLKSRRGGSCSNRIRREQCLSLIHI